MGKIQSAEAGSKVVGIGASAGGLAALRQFLHAMPADSGLAYVIVVHLAPDHPSLLSDLLQVHSSVPVVQVTETVKLEANQVYVIPPGRNISTLDTHLRLSPLETDRRLRAPIDHFFGTIAETHGTSAVGVILSGTGSDGSAGLRKIKYAGGLTIVQDPNEAEYDGMPQSAIATGQVDFILPVDEIPGYVVRFVKTNPHLPIPAEDESAPASVDPRVMQHLFAQLRARTGQDFSRYKESTVLRRIKRRMQIKQVEELSDYLKILQESQEENQALVDDLLITVTNFFRDAETFEKLKSDVLPLLFETKGLKESVRVWSVGCATGEEAYSLAMILQECCTERKNGSTVQIFATDMHQRSLARAREGIYGESIEQDVSAARLAQFFTRVPGGYQVRKDIRDTVVFASHNFLRDPPFSQMDLICCRNVMIYLKRDVQEEVMRLFHYALNPARYLLLGGSETVERSELFRVTDKVHSLYVRNNMQNHESRLPLFPIMAQKSHYGAAGSVNGGFPAGMLHQRMVERYAPPSILLNHELNIVHLSERAGTYLIQPGGEPTNNVLRRVRPELQMEVARLLHDARKGQQPVRSNPINVNVDGSARWITLRASATGDQEMDGLLLIIFDDATTSGSESEPNGSKHSGGLDSTGELELNRRRVQALIEQYESGQEEMQASNEELQSINEELRSTMEELETSKEELQSMNEELQTVNQENKHKVEELSQLSADLQNLLSATDIATLFLDRNLRILRFTPRVNELFNIRIVDRGRPLADLTHRLGYSNMLDDARDVLAKMALIEREVRSEDGKWFLARMLPYRISEDRFDGVVVTFVEISRLKSAEQASEESDERYRLLIENVAEYAIFMLSPSGQITTWNVGAERLFGYQEAEALGRPFELLFTPEDKAANLPAQIIKLATRDGQHNGDRRCPRRDGTTFWASGTMTALRRADGELRGFSKVMRDNTERRVSQAELENRNAELTRTNRELEEFAYVASHDLQEPLRMMNIYSQLLVQFVDVEHNAKAKQFAGFISSGAYRMEELINDLLGYSRVVHEEVEKSQVCDCEVVLQDALDTLDERIKQAAARVTHDKLPLVYGEARHISVVFQNLLSNSLKYRKADEPLLVHISAERSGPDWLLTVSDNGIGFHPEYSDRIFGLFKRLHKDAYPGTGLGLAICKQILERNGGKIWASSKGDGFGAKFFFTLRAASDNNNGAN